MTLKLREYMDVLTNGGLKLFFKSVLLYGAVMVVLSVLLSFSGGQSKSMLHIFLTGNLFSAVIGTDPLHFLSTRQIVQNGTVVLSQENISAVMVMIRLIALIGMTMLIGGTSNSVYQLLQGEEYIPYYSNAYGCLSKMGGYILITSVIYFVIAIPLSYVPQYAEAITYVVASFLLPYPILSVIPGQRVIKKTGKRDRLADESFQNYRDFIAAYFKELALVGLLIGILSMLPITALFVPALWFIGYPLYIMTLALITD